MDLWARIKGKDYPIASGASFSDELSETLDSGTIRIVHIHEALDIKPYDDIIIHDENYDNTKRTYDDGYTGDGFYKHMLVYSLQREQLSIDSADLSERKIHPDGQEYQSWYFNYTISLISEIKALEKIQLPNRTITQPMRTSATSNVRKAKTLFDVAKSMVNLYSPWIKVVYGETSWISKRKYHFYEGTDSSHLGYETVQLLKKKNCPEMSWQLPNLREVLNQIFYVIDAIPVVKDGIITHISLSDRNKKFSVWEKQNDTLVPNEKYWGRDVWMMDGSSYTDRIIREHSNSLSQYSTIHMVENLGFKNSSSGKLTLDTMRLELTYPIYEIKKVYMCYWKKTSDNTIYKVKQDITKVVIRSEQRNLLSEDWTKYSVNTINSEEEFCKFKYATIGYSQYSNMILGWGEKYTYLDYKFFFNSSHTSTVIENIYHFYDKINPYGVCDIDKVINKNDSKDSDEYYIVTYNNGAEYKIFDGEPQYYTTNDKHQSIFKLNNGYLSETDEDSWFSNFSLFLKTVFFEVEYDGIISSSVSFSKTDHDGAIVTRDNPTNSLAYVELDGDNAREKVNRLGNASLTLEQVAKNMDELQQLADYRTDDPLVDGERPLHEDEIIYRRSYTIFKDHIDAQYNLCKDYVLRNYFTSVYSKLRPFSYISYGQSVERKENKSVQIYFSLNHSYFQHKASFHNVYINDRKEFLSKVVSFYKPTKYDENSGQVENDMSNCAYMYIPNPNKNENANEGVYWGLFESDFQKYSTGNALCFNISMQDSVSAGVYISKYAPIFSKFITSTLFLADTKKNLDLLSGSLQEWYTFPVDKDTGAMAELQFGIGSVNKNEKNTIDKSFAISSILEPQLWTKSANLGNETVNNCGVRYYSEGTTWVDTYNDESKNSSALELTTFMKAKFYEDDNNQYNVDKDGAEKLNVTLEAEFVSDDNIFISNNAVRLSDAYGQAEKVYDEQIEIKSWVRSHVSKNWAVWELSILGLENNGDVEVWRGWGELMALIPTLNLCINQSEKYIGNIKTYDKNEMKFNWGLQSGSNFTINIKSIEWVSKETAFKDSTGGNTNCSLSNISISDFESMFDAEISFTSDVNNPISISNGDEVCPLPRVVVEIGSNEYIVYATPVAANADSLSYLANMDGTWKYSPEKAYASVGLNFKNTCGKYVTSMSYDIFNYNTNWGTNLIKSTASYGLATDVTINYVLSFSGVAQFVNEFNLSESLGNSVSAPYQTDYFFKNGQTTDAFKSKASFVDLNKEGINRMHLMEAYYETNASGISTFTYSGMLKEPLSYIQTIFSHYKEFQTNNYKTKNMIWVYSSNPLEEKDKYIEYIYEDGTNDLKSRWENIMSITNNFAESLVTEEEGKYTFSFPNKIPANGSVALYYLEDNHWKFVFGINNTGKSKTKALDVYISLLEDRSKTVYDSNMDETYTIFDYAKDDTYTFGQVNRIKKKMV